MRILLHIPIPKVLGEVRFTPRPIYGLVTSPFPLWCCQYLLIQLRSFGKSHCSWISPLFFQVFFATSLSLTSAHPIIIPFQHYSSSVGDLTCYLNFSEFHLQTGEVGKILSFKIILGVAIEMLFSMKQDWPMISLKYYKPKKNF